MIVNVRVGGTSNRYHWVVFGIDDEGVPQEGLYRAGTADYPHTLLEFPFPQHAAYPFSPFVAEPVPPSEEDDPEYEPDYRYIKVRAIVGNAEDNVAFTLVFPGWLAIDQENCCYYELEGPTIKVVNYQLRSQPARLCIGPVISDGPDAFDIGTLPPEYDGKRHPGVGWYVYKQSGTEQLSKDPNNPTIFTINFTQTPP